jgi:hypothetical protein
VEARFIPFGDSANLEARLVHGLHERTTSSEIILDAPIELLADVDHVESHFDPFGDSVSVSAREVHGLRQTYQRLRNRFGHTQWYSEVTRLKSKLNLVRWEIVLILTRHRCTVWAERTIGLEKSFWTHRMELLGDVGCVKSCSALFGDCVCVDARQVHGLRQTYHRLINHF